MQLRAGGSLLLLVESFPQLLSASLDALAAQDAQLNAAAAASPSMPEPMIAVQSARVPCGSFSLGVATASDGCRKLIVEAHGSCVFVPIESRGKKPSKTANPRAPWRSTRMTQKPGGCCNC